MVINLFNALRKITIVLLEIAKAFTFGLSILFICWEIVSKMKKHSKFIISIRKQNQFKTTEFFFQIQSG
jgi:hypothetical protein